MSEEAASPTFSITLCGTTVSQAVPKAIQHLMVEDHVDMIAMCTATFGPGSLVWSSITLGGDVEVTVTGSTRIVFKGFVTEVRSALHEGERSISIVAMDPQIKLAASRRTRVFEEQKDSDIVTSVLGGLAGTVEDTGESTTKKYDFQRNESDLYFLKRLAARNNYYMLGNTEGKVDFKKASFTADAIPIESSKITGNFEFVLATAAVPQEVTVHGWDYVTKAMVEGTAGQADVDSLGSGTNITADAPTLWQGDNRLSDNMVTSQDGAKSVATAELSRLARGYLRGKVKIEVNAAIYAGCKVTLPDHGDGFNPEGVVLSTRHSFDTSGRSYTEVTFCGNTKPA
jgi:phage protein D